MTCENIFCIYQNEKSNECCLDEISINNAGMCDDCIYVDMDELELQKQKDKILKIYEDDYKKYDY